MLETHKKSKRDLYSDNKNIYTENYIGKLIIKLFKI